MNKQKDKELSYEELFKKSDEYLNGWKRALADYHNLERETEKKKNDWLTGIEHVTAQFKKVLEENGVREIKTVGEKFDPEVHEAVVAQETSGSEQKQDNIIKKEVKTGYKLNGKVIYPAKVIV